MNSYNTFLCLDSSTAKHMVLRLIHKNHIYDAPQETEHLESTLIPSIELLLKNADIQVEDIEAYVLGAGPGSFMGLRLGFSVLRAWAWLYDKPITMISSLELLRLSYPHSEDALYIPCVDAKMKNVFAHIFFKGELLLEDSDISPQELGKTIENILKEKNIKKAHIFGSGSSLLEEFPITHAIYDKDFQTLPHSFSLDFLQKIAPEKFSTKALDQLASIEPQYLRLSAAEMALKEKNEHSL